MSWIISKSSDMASGREVRDAFWWSQRIFLSYQREDRDRWSITRVLWEKNFGASQRSWRNWHLVWAAITKYHRLDGYKQHLFFTVLEVGRPKSECHHGQVLMRATPWLQTAIFSLYPHMVEVERGWGRGGESKRQGETERSVGSLIRALTPFIEAPPSLLNHLPKALPLNTITLRA